jgi:hypothetical protein
LFKIVFSCSRSKGQRKSRKSTTGQSLQLNSNEKENQQMCAALEQVLQATEGTKQFQMELY